MTLRSDMRIGLNLIPTYMGESWEFRQLTSGPAVQTRVYGSWTAFTVHVTARSNVEEFDNDRNAWTRREKGRLRVADTATVLHQGDQVRDTTTTVNNPNLWWAIMGVESSGVGTIAYAISRDIPLKVAPDRKAGV